MMLGTAPILSPKLARQVQADHCYLTEIEAAPRMEEITQGDGRRFNLLEGNRNPALASMVGQVVAVATLERNPAGAHNPVHHMMPPAYTLQ